MSTIKELSEQIHQNKINKGWKVTTPLDWVSRDTQVPAVLALIHSEASEALEAFRNGDFEGFASELADIVIRTIGLAHGLNIDLEKEIIKKMKINEKRAFQHGGKRI